MTKVETVSVALFAFTLIAVPVLLWTAMMYRELQFTGQMIAALT